MMYQRFKDDMSVMIVNYIFLVMIFYLIASVTSVKVITLILSVGHT